MSRTFSVKLACGCLCANMESDGWCGLMPCYAEEGDMANKKDRTALALHKKCMKEYFKVEIE